MNTPINFFGNPIIQIFIIIILIIIIIWFFSENFSNINNNFNRRPPHIEQLPNQQLIPQVPPAASQEPAFSQVSSSSDRDGMSIGPPNFGRKNQENTPDNTRMVPGNVYRMNTGRDAYQEEQFVSIYDANFGGMLGTNMGL